MELVDSKLSKDDIKIMKDNKSLFKIDHNFKNLEILRKQDLVEILRAEEVNHKIAKSKSNPNTNPKDNLNTSTNTNLNLRPNELIINAIEAKKQHDLKESNSNNKWFPKLNKSESTHNLYKKVYKNRNNLNLTLILIF